MSTFAVTSLRTLTRAATRSVSRNAVASSSRLARPLSTSVVRLVESDPTPTPTPASSGAGAAATPSKPSSTLGSLAAAFETASAASTLPLPGAPSVAPEQASIPVGTHYSPNALPPTSDPLIGFWINLLMREGKKGRATRQILEMLQHMASWLHTDPLPVLASATALASPLVRTRTAKSGGKSTIIPIALNPRQSNHRGIKAIIEASKKRGDRDVAVRLAREVCAVIEGNSSVLAKKDEVHKFAAVNRSNLSVRI